MLCLVTPLPFQAFRMSQVNQPSAAVCATCYAMVALRGVFAAGFVPRPNIRKERGGGGGGEGGGGEEEGPMVSRLLFSQAE